MSDKSATVIIPTTGALAGRPQMLRPLLADPACGELLVVVDGEQPATARVLAGFAAAEPRVRLMSTRQSGAGGMFARHAGAEAASQEILVFIDDDVLASPRLVSDHVAHHERAAELVVLGYMPVRTQARRRRPDYPARLYAEAYESMCQAYERDHGEVLRNFWGGNYSLRRAHALRAGPPDASLGPVYHADREFGLRLARLGLEPRFDRALRAEHLYRRSPAEFVRDCRRGGAGRLIVHARHVDLVGSLSPDAYEQGLPPRSRRLVAACRRRPALSRAAALALRGGAVLAAAAGRTHDELRLGRALRSVEQQRGMLAARANSITA